MYGELFLWMAVSILTVMAVWHIAREFVDHRVYSAFAKGAFVICAIILLVVSHGKRMSTEQTNVSGDDTTETVTQTRTDEVAKEKVAKRKQKVEVDKQRQKQDEEEIIESMDEFRRNIMNRRDKPKD